MSAETDSYTRIAVTLKEDAVATFDDSAGKTGKAAYSILCTIKVPGRIKSTDFSIEFHCATEADDARALSARLKKDRGAELVVRLEGGTLIAEFIRVDSVDYKLKVGPRDSAVLRTATPAPAKTSAKGRQ